MSDKGVWNQDWIEVQQKYWENLTEMGRKAMGMQTPTKSPWENAMNHWWQTISPGAPDPAREFMEKILEQGKTFFRMADQFAQNLQGTAPTTDWPEALNKVLGDLQKTFTDGAQGMGTESLHKMMAFWEMPLDNWQRMVSSLSLMPGDLLRNMPHGMDFERYLSAPGLGYTREGEAQQKEILRLMMEYQRELQEYTQFFSNLGSLAVERMQQKTSQLSEDGQTIESARALYDLWIVSCEEVYGEQVMTPQYAEIHGNLVNTLMAFKKHMSQMVDENLGAFNMPTRSEIHTLQDRLQETRRENKQLRRELDELREKVDKLTTTRLSAASEKKAAPRKKAAVKKKAANNQTAASKTKARPAS
ncbi:MAG: class III poly(R)-hydroxyalkanoic acid synthase subunit PhaE [Gammaproteobacteria bacterium]|nr:class III poly(R)-hydroxyalkanoic acid synthase subunit PhaE [Gammaproteobacteria bacterium]